MTEPARISDLWVLAPDFALSLHFALAELHRQGLPVQPYETGRTEERQQWLYAQGRTRPGTVVTNAKTALFSWHGFYLASDLVFLTDRGEWVWPADSDTRWDKLATVVRQFGLVSGRNWASVKDSPHVQPANLKTSPSDLARALYAKGGLVAVWEATGHHTIRPETARLLAA